MFHKVESWNLQHLFGKEFRETSQNFNSIRQPIEKWEIKSVWIRGVSWNFWGFTKFFFKQMLKVLVFHLKKTKKFYSLKIYDLSRSLQIDQDISNRWHFVSYFSVTVLHKPIYYFLVKSDAVWPIVPTYLPMGGFICTFWYSLSSTSSIL